MKSSPGFSTLRHVDVEIDRRMAIQRAIEGAEPGDTILIAGQRARTVANHLDINPVVLMTAKWLAKSCWNAKPHALNSSPAVVTPSTFGCLILRSDSMNPLTIQHFLRTHPLQYFRITQSFCRHSRSCD